MMGGGDISSVTSVCCALSNVNKPAFACCMLWAFVSGGSCSLEYFCDHKR